MMDEEFRTTDDDSVLAEDLQLAEGLLFSTMPERTCVFCSEGTPSSEALQKPDNFDHLFCTPCFCQYAEAQDIVLKCPVASCESLFKPEIHQEIKLDGDCSTKYMDYGKGNKLPNDVRQKSGQCSQAATISKEFYCTICMETLHTAESFGISGCTHVFCISCISQYIAAKVEDNILLIGCPDTGCKDGVLHPELCKDVIPSGLFQRWGVALCDSALGALKFYCPFVDCSALLVDDHGKDEEAITNAECPHCYRMFCAQCKVPWHDSITCAEFQRLGEDERGQEDLLLKKVASESKWQRCPKCKMYVERAEGCVFIICRCRHCFCYLCASPMSRDNHHCKSCNRTW